MRKFFVHSWLWMTCDSASSASLHAAGCLLACPQFMDFMVSALGIDVVHSGSSSAATVQTAASLSPSPQPHPSPSWHTQCLGLLASSKWGLWQWTLFSREWLGYRHPSSSPCWSCGVLPVTSPCFLVPSPAGTSLVHVLPLHFVSLATPPCFHSYAQPDLLLLPQC